MRKPEELEEFGKYFGYPDCCVQEFIEKTPEQRTKNQMDRDVHQHSGFIPCACHADEIKSGRITLHSLIAKRESPLPFPQQESGEKAFELIDIIKNRVYNKIAT